MSNINIGSAVRLKGDHRVMTVTGIDKDLCVVEWIIEGDRINEKKYIFSALEIVPESELERKKENDRKLFEAKLKSANADIFKKIGTTLAAIVSALALFYQASKVGDIDKNLERMLSKNQSNEKTIESIKEMPSADIEAKPK